MSSFLSIAVTLVLSYLLGAIPFALIVGKVFYSVDLRECGSGNLGATNVYRELGWKPGLAVLLLDMAKGAVAVAIGYLVNLTGFGPQAQDWILITATLAALAGHSYSPYVRFRGGKGVATAAGALLILTPLAWPLMLVTFAGTVLLSRMVSLGSIVTASIYPPLTLWFYGDHPPIVLMSFVAAGLVLWRHRSNIGRIYRGEEAKLGRSADAVRAAAAGKSSVDEDPSGTRE